MEMDAERKEPVWEARRKTWVCPRLFCGRELEQSGTMLFCRASKLAWDYMADQWVPVHGIDFDAL
jgi:hypothetical protein